MTKNLTTGTPYKIILKFAIPMVLGNLFQQIYNMADSVIVGRLVGEDALAGVGATGSLNFLIIGFVIGLSSGFAVPMSQAFGAKDFDKIREYYANSLILTIVMSTAISILSLVFLEDILLLMNTPAEIMNHTISYASTMFMGLIGIFLYNLMASVMRALGDSKTPLYYLIFASILNIALSLAFVIFFNWGVFGTGLATAISQGISGILCFFTARKKFDILCLNKKDLSPKTDVMSRLLKIGLPMGLQFSITAIGALILQTSINSLGALYVLAVSTGSRIGGILLQALDTIGLAMTTYTGQNLGAGKIKRISIGLKHSLVISTIYSIICLGAAYLFGGEAISVFINEPSQALRAATHEFIIGNAYFYILLGALLIFRNLIQGLGYSGLTMIVGFAETIARALAAFVLVENFGYIGVILASPLAWLVALSILIPMYIFVMKSVKEKIPDRT